MNRIDPNLSLPRATVPRSILRSLVPLWIPPLSTAGKIKIRRGDSGLASLSRVAPWNLAGGWAGEVVPGDDWV